ncbi:restriction endonuclease subunit S [Flavobacterium sp. FPG59]|uniref:restriction endonuclease subunit S n=1 Tax=Flavobacterium sp. FPG59 TaxID=1929267 RepID=UPI000A3AA5E6|nr:restriction endonuclease subunit S [Flavobacterium sp. FPG59]OUD36618.1 hypothetical protein FPG59_05300 [Flavobacterium sp. FPG59]
MNSLNVPKLRFPGFDGEWEKKSIEDLCIMQAGKFISASEIKDNYSEGMFPCYGGNGLRGYTATFNCDGNFSLIGRQGALCGNITFAKNKFYATEHAIVVNVKQNIDTNWMFYILNIQNLNQYATGQAQPGLSVQNIKKVAVTVTNSLPEQQKIASFLSAVEKKIQQLSRKKELLEQYKKGVMQQLFSGKLRFKDENGKDYPDWEEKKLGELVTLMQSGISRMLSDTDIGLPIIRSNNLQNGRIDVTDIKYWFDIDNQGANLENYVLFEGDLLVNFINSIAQIGKVAMFSDLMKRKTIFTTNLLRLRFNEKVISQFMINYFHLKKYEDFIQSITKPAVNQASFTTKDFRTFTVNLPSLPEQQKIANFLSGIDGKIEQVNGELVKTQEFKKGLLQQMFV